MEQVYQYYVLVCDNIHNEWVIASTCTCIHVCNMSHLHLVIDIFYFPQKGWAATVAVQNSMPDFSAKMGDKLRTPEQVNEE